MEIASVGPFGYEKWGYSLGRGRGIPANGGSGSWDGGVGVCSSPCVSLLKANPFFGHLLSSSPLSLQQAEGQFNPFNAPFLLPPQIQAALK